MILENGVVRTLDPSLPLARALAIAGERIAGGVGTHETALPTPEVVDLGGRCVLPGFNDAHVHFPTWALARRQVRLEGAGSREEALALLRAAAESLPRGRWLRGYGWRDQQWAHPPARGPLDAVSGEAPAAVWSRDYHSLWLNSAALARAGGRLDVEGGVVERDEQGAPTGVLREAAAWRFRDLFLDTPDEEWDEAVREGLGVASARGVTAIHDKDGWLGAQRIWRRFAARDALPLRVWQSLPAERVGELEALELPAGVGDDRLRLGYLKAFVDGTLGSGTALLLDGGGVRITGRAQLEEWIRRGAALGWPLAVHAIGDRANRDALDAFEATADAWRPRGLRPRVEHAQLLAPEDLPRFAALGVAASVQFSHAPSDRDLAESAWRDRLDGGYAYRSLWDSGALVANGSDAPIEELDPLMGIRAAVLRTLDGRPPWRPEQALTVEQALRATTANAARLAGDGRRRGRLLPGLLADLVVLDRDPLAIDAAELAEVQVVATMVGGRWTHNPPPWD